tara:strand:- start:56713 stop:57975 length:1263 start_codon:yes stop_codon:yes gene_type:complete
MSETTESIETKVETVNINIDELFNGAPSAEGITLPQEESTKPNIFSNKNNSADMSFTEPEESSEEVEGESQEEVSDQKDNQETKEIFEEINENTDDSYDEDAQYSSTKKLTGISNVFNKLIEKDKIIPFDDGKDLNDYSAKDWEELIDANMQEVANKVRKETPKQFFESLPQELQIAARYVAEGGTDMKGLFLTLANVEEHRSLDVKKEKDQEYIITEYLSATGYGSQEEIEEEIETWKDLGKLEQKASKFKPKLDKMQEKVVAKKLEEQENKRLQQENASKQYMGNVYNSLKEGMLGDIKLNRKTQSMLYNGLVSPSFPSVTGKNTNLLGHLLEKYQFVEPNYTIIAEALWLLSDPNGYKNKIMEKGAQQSVAKTVRKLKTEQGSNKGSSLGVQKAEQQTKRSPRKNKIKRSNNIFKRF